MFAAWQHQVRYIASEEMADPMTKQIPWRRVFVEGVVIVGSILLAFGIQAWWDD